MTTASTVVEPMLFTGSTVYPSGGPLAASGRAPDCPFAPGSLLGFPASPDFRTGHSVVILPGGGYQMLAWEKEGVRIARWLAAHGISAFVYFYPVGAGARFPGPLLAARDAVRWVRHNSANWGGDPAKVGILGFSAGGHLAGLTAFTSGGLDAIGLPPAMDARPDFAALIYAVCTFKNPHAHVGSRSNLLGADAPMDLCQMLSLENQVDSGSPPVFLVHTSLDNSVVPANSLNLALALQECKVPVELHLYRDGVHGIGLARNHPWGRALIEWLGVPTSPIP